MVFIILRNDAAPLNSVSESALIHQSAKPFALQWLTIANFLWSRQENLKGCQEMSNGDFRASVNAAVDAFY
jgi:hypothetical protein